MTDTRNLSDWKEILVGAEDDERASAEWLEDCERTLVKARNRHAADLRSLARIVAHVALLEALAAEPLDKPVLQ